MKTPIALALIGTFVLASCSNKAVIVQEEDVPAIEDAGMPLPPPPDPGPPALVEAPVSVPTSVPFRTPAVTNTLVNENDLLSGSGGPAAPASSGAGEPGTVIARPPATGGSE